MSCPLARIPVGIRVSFNFRFEFVRGQIVIKRQMIQHDPGLPRRANTFLEELGDVDTRIVLYP